jgi:hypothetical protein
MMQEIDGQLAIGTDWRMEVYDSDGPVFQITFGAKSLRPSRHCRNLSRSRRNTSAVRAVDGDPPVMTAFFKPSGMPIEKQAVQLHNPVDPLVVGRGRARCASRSAQHGMNAAIAVGRQSLMTVSISATSSPSGSGGRPILARSPPLERSAMLERATPIVSHTTFIGNRPSATTATATSLWNGSPLSFGA